MNTHGAKLTVNRNGIVCLATWSPGLTTSCVARDVRFALEYKERGPGWHHHATYSDAPSAWNARKNANATFIWRLVAFNDDGRIVLPAKWKPYRG